MTSLPSIKCSGCGACVQICSRDALSFLPNYEGFLYPSVDTGLCIECRLCERTCPVLDEKHSGYLTERKAYAVCCNDEKTRLGSSSGGMFTVLAEKIIEGGGIVFGAEFDTDFSVKHGWTERIEGLERFRGSKYLQSRTEDTFRECREFLDEGRKVLYTGTPCQIAGLKAFLRKDYANLFTADVVCHGVPSPALWKKYIEHREKKSASLTVRTAFRRKDDGWKLFSLAFAFADASEYRKVLTKDKYMQIFLHDSCLRESCYQCSFRGDGHMSDLTLADFWGVENLMPEMFDDKGTSLVIVQTAKGGELLKSVMDRIKIETTDFGEAVKFNPSYFESKPRSALRTGFYRDLQSHGIGWMYRKYGKETFPSRIKHFAKRCILFSARLVLGKKWSEKIKNRIKEVGKNKII